VNNQPTGSNPIGGFGAGNPNYERPEQFPPQTAAQKVDRGKTRGETVTLRLELAAYFRRPDFQPLAASLER
jgi:hypothetical protein